MTPACMHCGETFEQHEVRGDDRWCRDGARTFNFEFHLNPEVIAFVRQNPDTPVEELTRRWINHVVKKP